MAMQYSSSTQTLKDLYAGEDEQGNIENVMDYGLSLYDIQDYVQVREKLDRIAELTADGNLLSWDDGAELRSLLSDLGLDSIATSLGLNRKV